MFESEAAGVRYFLVKPIDVAIYVEHGAADIGIVGKDILLESGADVYELLDLGLGRCRMCVAGKSDYVEDTDRTLRVATKFVNIAKRYYSEIGREIEIIKLNGSIPDAILAAAKLAGVDRIFKMGGAQAVAALTYGSESVPRVDKIVGPGNVFVATAKRKVFGQVAIDMIAGPSEILVLADDGCNARCVAADMLSQAEHDRLATAVLVTTSPRLADEVAGELERQIPLLPRADITRESIDTNGKIILCEDLNEAVRASNAIAPEHLELCVEDPFALLDRIVNAGSVFLGRNVPEALGDYLAGPNHTLPTSGTARFSSPLSVDDFVKKSSFLYYSREALCQVCGDVARFARMEGLEGHARSIESRFEEDPS